MSEIQLSKIAITEHADSALMTTLEKVNLNFEGGRVTKTDLASWIILKLANEVDESIVDEIRKAHFNQVAYLDSLVKRLKSTGRDSLESGDLVMLQAMLGQQTTKKRGKNSKGSEAVQEDN